MRRVAHALLLCVLSGCASAAPELEIAVERRDAANEGLLHRFYAAFAQHDAAGMAACYADDVVFSDPVFTELRGPEAGAMWAMLCEQGVDLRVYHWGVQADAERGRAHWDAFYTFTATGRRVHNRIDARFRFRDGKIVEHRDHFDLWRWTRMAVPYLGDLLGWGPVLRAPLRLAARQALDDWIDAHPAD